MRAFSKAAALAAAVFLASSAVLLPVTALAQSASSAIESSAAIVTGGTVSVSLAAYINPIIEFVGSLAGLGAAASIVALIVSILPPVVRPFATSAVQSAIAHFIEQGIGWAIQEVENFDKDKKVDFNVGSAGVASALGYVLNAAPAFLVKLAGGKDAISSLIVSALGKFGIMLDSGVSAQQVASTAAKST